MERYSRYRLKRGQLAGAGPRVRGAALFVAYRFRNSVSKTFRETLEARMRNSEGLCGIEVTDGHVDKGEHWLQEIRKRITRCRLVVADVTGLSPEVLFELGLAWGMKKPIMPVVAEHGALASLPRWLTELEIGYFADDTEWAALLDSIGARISRKSKAAQTRTVPDPIPGRALWLGGQEAFEKLRQHMVHTATQYDLTMPEQESPPSLADAEESLANEVCRASLVVASLSSSDSDTFVHFAAGLVVTKPMAGAATEKLRRRVILAVPDTLRIEDVVSDSASRFHGTVKAVRYRGLAQDIVNWGKLYKRYNEKVSGPAVTGHED